MLRRSWPGGRSSLRGGPLLLLGLLIPAGGVEGQEVPESARPDTVRDADPETMRRMEEAREAVRRSVEEMREARERLREARAEIADAMRESLLETRVAQERLREAQRELAAAMADVPGSLRGWELAFGEPGARLHFFDLDSIPGFGRRGEPFAPFDGIEVGALTRGGIFPFGRSGIEFVPLNPELGEYFGRSEGVLVSEVSDRTEWGLLPGDVLLEVGGEEVRTVAEARRAIARLDAGAEVELRVLRRGEERRVTATVPESPRRLRIPMRRNSGPA